MGAVTLLRWHFHHMRNSEVFLVLSLFWVLATRHVLWKIVKRQPKVLHFRSTVWLLENFQHLDQSTHHEHSLWVLRSVTWVYMTSILLSLTQRLLCFAIFMCSCELLRRLVNFPLRIILLLWSSFNRCSPKNMINWKMWVIASCPKVYFIAISSQRLGKLIGQSRQSHSYLCEFL